MAVHSSILAWRIPGTEEPVRLQSIGSQRVGHDLSDLAHTHMEIKYPESVQFSRSVVSDSLRHHGPEHARPLCLSQTPRVHPNSCPLSQ